MLKNPLHASRSHFKAHYKFVRSHVQEPAPEPTVLLSEDPFIVRHEHALLARHQEAFLAAARRHAGRANLLQRSNRQRPAQLHDRTARLLQAYAQPGEIERLPLIERPGPRGSARIGSVHPAMVAFIEGAAEEFFRIYSDAGPATEWHGSANLLNAFRRANFHRIYIGRLLELDSLMREGRASAIAEATLMRRYGPHDL